MIRHKRVLFLCTGNPTRSLMTKALLNRQAGEHFEVFGAGTQPEEIGPRTLVALKTVGIPAEGLCSKSLSEFTNQFLDFVTARHERGHTKNPKILKRIRASGLLTLRSKNLTNA